MLLPPNRQFSGQQGDRRYGHIVALRISSPTTTVSTQFHAYFHAGRTRLGAKIKSWYTAITVSRHWKAAAHKLITMMMMASEFPCLEKHHPHTNISTPKKNLKWLSAACTNSTQNVLYRTNESLKNPETTFRGGSKGRPRPTLATRARHSAVRCGKVQYSGEENLSFFSNFGHHFSQN